MSVENWKDFSLQFVHEMSTQKESARTLLLFVIPAFELK